MDKKVFSDSKVIENKKGGKESNIEVSVVLTKGYQGINLWKWSVRVNVYRNKHPFSGNNQIVEGDPSQLVIDIFAKVCDKIRETYNGACNVDCDAIIEFVEASKAKFLDELQVELSKK